MKTRLSLFVPAVFAALLLVLCGWQQTARADGPDHFQLNDLQGRYVESAHAEDISSQHGETSGDIDPSIPFVSANVMNSDGKGNVCGESSGFYGQEGSPFNLGPSTFHGKYTVDAATGRVTIDTCSDAGPFCASPAPNCTGTSSSDPTSAAADSANNHKTQMGYLGHHNLLSTVERLNGTFSSGFLVHHHNWEQAGNGDHNGNGDHGKD